MTQLFPNYFGISCLRCDVCIDVVVLVHTYSNCAYIVQDLGRWLESSVTIMMALELTKMVK